MLYTNDVTVHGRADNRAMLYTHAGGMKKSNHSFQKYLVIISAGIHCICCICNPCRHHSKDASNAAVNMLLPRDGVACTTVQAKHANGVCRFGKLYNYATDLRICVNIYTW